MSNNTLLSVTEEFKRFPNTIMLVSMAKRAKMPQCDLYVDVSTFMEDSFDFNMNGTEPYIQNTLRGFHGRFIDALAETLVQMNVESGVIAVIACKAGQRRSVATVELLNKYIWNEYPSTLVRVVHYELLREQAAWLKF